MEGKRINTTAWAELMRRTGKDTDWVRFWVYAGFASPPASLIGCHELRWRTSLAREVEELGLRRARAEREAVHV